MQDPVSGVLARSTAVVAVIVRHRMACPGCAMALDDCRPALDQLARDGLIRVAGGHVHVTPAGRPFTRVVAAAFDAYLEPATGRHSAAV